ncbi:HAD family hydrolase [Curtobacterium sp. RRHDQ10]|uniref:HAD family hydrolase n=1 Tax=Curtobacterium phyllosphaerae TaxID=3413379 RepID=UPI003BF1B88B
MTLHEHAIVRGVLLGHAGSMVVDPGTDPAEPAAGTARPGARRAVDALRAAGLPVGAVAERPAADHRVESLVGPLDAWFAGTGGPADEATVRQAASALGIVPAELVVIGDGGPEMRAARAAGAAGILVPSDGTRDDGVDDADVVVPSLLDAVALVLHMVRRAAPRAVDSR